METQPGSPEPRVYKVEPFAYIFAVATVFFTVIGLAVLLPQSLDNDPDVPLFFLIIWFGILGWFWFNVVSTPYRALLYSDGRLELQTLARRKTVHALEIKRIRGGGLAMGYTGAVIEHTNGKIWLRTSFVNFFDFLTRLKELNPAIEIVRL